MPDRTHGTAWVCEENRDVILAIFWISLIQLIFASFSFLSSFWDEQADLFSVKVKFEIILEHKRMMMSHEQFTWKIQRLKSGQHRRTSAILQLSLSTEGNGKSYKSIIAFIQGYFRFAKKCIQRCF